MDFLNNRKEVLAREIECLDNRDIFLLTLFSKPKRRLA
jgi:hypothetical protein